MKYLAVFGAASALFVSAAALAQPSRVNEIETLAKCRKIVEDPARLACYDSATSSLEAATAAGDIVVVKREQAREVRRQAFGFSMPSLSLFEGSGDDGQELTLKVLAASRGGDGKWVLHLEGGQTWRQIDTADLNRHPKVGGTVTIRRAALGSYRLSAGGASAIRVKREE
jgi:hypothetical protein